MHYTPFVRHIINVSIKAAKELTLRRLAKAAVVAVLLSTLAAAQGAGMAMPDNCQVNLDKCSQKIWAHDSFPRRGVTQSVAFSNGVTLTCTSEGANVPRDCGLSDADTGPPQVTSASALKEANGAFEKIPNAPLPYQCAALKQALHDLQSAVDNLQQPIDHEQAYFKRVMQMTPAMLDAEIQRQQRLSHDNLVNTELDFLMDLRTNKLLGPAGASLEKMQARGNQIVKNEQQEADTYREKDTFWIEVLSNRMASLDCKNVPIPAQ